jgi:hypothetical protein
MGIDISPDTSALTYKNYSISPSPMLHSFSNPASLNYTLHTLRINVN